MKISTKRCAIYTRKSSEEGLEQEFNSLHAQRESCEAYIASQKSEGWMSIKTLYNDGGFSGGNIERPALKQLIEDVKANRIDTVVVYKIDRLTRSLMDFSKLVEVFDEYGVTFISVTQSFNTTTSMGRLTLNVLLSFAQFEREVTGERIRDKIAASKAKGMWMGGTVPLGYDVENRHLIVNEKGAEVVRLIYNKYLELGSVSLLKEFLDRNCIKSKVTEKSDKRKGGRPISRGNLYITLTSPLYIGKVKHKEAVYEGQHEGIVDPDIWEAVQLRLQDRSVKPRKSDYTRIDKLLSRKLFDCDGNIYTPSASTMRGNKQYRYYISQNLTRPRNHPKHVIARIPAEQIEKIISNAVKDCLINSEKMSQVLNVDDQALLSFLKENFDNTWINEIIKHVMTKVVINLGTLEMHLSKPKLNSLLSKKLNINLPDSEDEIHIEKLSFITRRGDRVTIIAGSSPEKLSPFAKDPIKLKNWVRSIVWREEFFDGVKIEDIAKRENFTSRYIGRQIEASLTL
jgi:DNA invertase Pin-like site-specific DNA recombinase